MSDVTFYSARFSHTPAPDAINEMLGRDLAEWLRDNLTDFEVGEIIAEDYGYGFWLILEKSHYWITCTEYEPPENDTPSRWLVGIHYDPGCFYLRRLRNRPNPDAIPSIAKAIHELIANDDSISKIEWWSEDVGRGENSSEPNIINKKIISNQGNSDVTPKH